MSSSTVQQLTSSMAGMSYFSINVSQGEALTYWTYKRHTFLNFFGSYTSIALGCISIAAFLCKTHVNFERNVSMLAELYWKEKPTEGKVDEELSIDD